MSDCDNLHPPFWERLRDEDVACRTPRRPRPSLVEGLAVVAVLAVVLVTNFDRWTGDANAEALPAVTTLDDTALDLGSGYCRDDSFLERC